MQPHKKKEEWDMWKKLVSGFLAMMLLMTMVLTASAEDTYTLRNGVQFGDTVSRSEPRRPWPGMRTIAAIRCSGRSAARSRASAM